MLAPLNANRREDIKILTETADTTYHISRAVLSKQNLSIKRFARGFTPNQTTTEYAAEISQMGVIANKLGSS